ncbi:MAG: D-alanyl-D-alanine carboxypeptidase family protein [Oscillospiraceae bacterium]|nr:hypothetical protein [Oscillospiraceae bacterium]MCR5306833.1 D-alanyl-D-alanine carboxypeptidase family protein [Oscillospiraceae bacterium]
MAKRRRIRWDRVIIAGAVLIALILLMGSCVHSCSEGEVNLPSNSSGSPLEPLSTGKNSNQNNSQSSKTDGSENVTPGTQSSRQDTPNVPTLPADYEQSLQPAAGVYTGSLVLVNDANPSRLSRQELDLQQVWYASDRPESLILSYPGYTFLNRTALTQFNRMMTAYYSVTNNAEIMFNYGYLEAGKEKSNPESATGLDVQLHLKLKNGSYAFISNTAPYSWIYEHMTSYGYVIRYPEEKSGITGVKSGGYTAIRYVGVPHAYYMSQNNLCLEEYLDLLKNQYTFGQGMLEFSAGEQLYRVYYVQASGTGDTEVPVPKTLPYDISGNNTDGYIVTVAVG